jgi:hypothetical protein
MLGEVKADDGNLHGVFRDNGGRLLSLWRSQTTTLWHMPPNKQWR